MSNFIDTTFNSPNGYISQGFYNGTTINDIILDNNGKYVVIGEIQESNNLIKMFIARYDKSGKLDKSFGGTGYVTKNFYNNKSTIGTSIILNNDGKYVVTGYAKDLNNIQKIFIARYTVNGQLDNTFNNPNGYQTYSFYTDKECYSNSIIIHNNKYVITGYTMSDIVYQLFIIRYTSNGQIDNTFNNPNGYVTKTFYTDKSCYSNEIILDSDGKYVITGNTGNLNNTVQLFIARYNSDGIIDFSFNSNGYETYTFYVNKYCSGESLIEDNKKYVVTGYTRDNNDIPQSFIARYDNSGTIDRSFNTNGYVIHNINTYITSTSKSIILHGGKYIVTGGTYTNNYIDKFFVSRYTNSGSIDKSFNSPYGYLTKTFYTNKGCYGKSIILDSNKYVIIGSTANSNNKSELTISRYFSSPIRVTGVRLNSTKATIKIKGTKKLIVTVLPTNASNKFTKWSTSNSKIAKVSNTGLVTGILPGKVTIKVTSVDGSKTASCIITVIRPVTGVKITPNVLKLKVKESKKLVASVIPVNASNKSIKWISSDPKKATVNKSGIVTAIRTGKVTITAISIEGLKKAKTIVTVLN
jgi:uncharacterized delta-60 repeat protein